MQASGWGGLKPHQEAPQGSRGCCPGRPGGGGRALTDCMQAREEDTDHAGEGRNRTEENSENRAPRPLTAAWPATSSHPARRQRQGPRRGTGTQTAPGRAAGAG